MKRITSPLIGAVAVGLLAATTVAVSAQDVASDGYDFERLAPLTENDRSGLYGIAELPNGLIAVVGSERPGGGTSGSTALSWTSSDGGATWTQGSFGPEIGYVVPLVAFGDQFVTIGGIHEVEESTPTSWVLTSSDGLDWSVVATLDNVEPRRLLATLDGLALLATEFREADGWGDRLAGFPSLLASSDAVTWETHEITYPIYGKDDEDERGLGDLARSDDGRFLAIGGYTNPETELTRFLVFYSEDGTDWIEATAPIAETDGFGVVISPVWTESGFLVSAFTDGSDASPAGLFLTDDGTEWEHVADIPGPDMPTIASDGDTTVGFRLPFAEGEGPPMLIDGSPVYVSTDGRAWEHPSPFVLDQGHLNAALITPDGRILMVGGDHSNCREFFCVFNSDNGAIPTAWIGTPR